MKRFIKKVGTALIASLLGMSALAMPIYAEEVTSITFNPAEAGSEIKFNTSQEFAMGGLFASYGMVYPGDVVDQTIRLINQSTTQAEYYLVMRVADQSGNKIDNMETLSLIHDLLYQGLLDIEIKSGNSVLYNGVIGGKLGNAQSNVNDATSGVIPLGTLASNHSADLTVTLKVDPKMGNEYQDLGALVNWLVEVRWDDTQPPIDPPIDPPIEPPVNPPIDPPVDPTPDPNPGEEIPDPDIPGGEAVIPDQDTEVTDEEIPAGPIDEEIPDEEVPLGAIPNQEKLPQTGDTFPIELVGGVGGVCALVFGVTLINYKKKSKP
ncbi:MAG: hypothetical protein ACRCW2_13600 [Cellulosilyticaceae bacterium]